MATNTSYQEITLTSDIVVTWPFSFTGGLIIADINNVNPNTDGWTITLPDATLARNGQTILFNNISSFSFETLANDSITSIVSIASGDVLYLYLTDTSTSNGTWSVIPFGSGTNAITAFTAESTDSTITITNGSITPPGGTINFKLPTNISNLNALSATGFLISTNASPLEYTTTTLVAGENIGIVNPDGITGEPVISLQTALTSLVSAQIGDMTISGSVIVNNNDNGSLSMTSNGTGNIFLNGVTIDADCNVTAINNFTVDGFFNNPFMPKAWVRFTDTIVGESNVIVITDSANVTSVTGSAGSYSIVFTSALISLDYGVHISCGTNGGSSPFISRGFDTVHEEGGVTISVVDDSGALVTSAPYGVTVTIFSSSV
jgi:hypothetical protein